MSANAFSLAGLAIGLTVIPLLAWGRYDMALLVILLNRLIDGLDGAIARSRGTTPFGGYLDIMCDMGFYAAVPLGFALARPDNALWAAVLLASFVCTASSFLGRAVLAAQRGEPDDGARGRKSFFRRLMKNTHGATVVEYTLIASLIAVAAIASMRSVGTKVSSVLGAVGPAIN